MEHRGNCSYVQKGATCDCGLWDQSATLFKAEARIRELEAENVRLKDMIQRAAKIELTDATRIALDLGKRVEPTQINPYGSSSQSDGEADG